MNDPEIAHAIHLLELHANSSPRSMSDATEWMHDARIAMEMAADAIEALAYELDAQQRHVERWEAIVDALMPLIRRRIEHPEGCDADGELYTWPASLILRCPACELLSLIRMCFDNHRQPAEIDAAIEELLRFQSF
jgi:hypothetical protein